MAKMDGMKVVVNALVGALPSIFNVLVIFTIAFYWLLAPSKWNTFRVRFIYFNFWLLVNELSDFRVRFIYFEWKNFNQFFEN